MGGQEIDPRISRIVKIMCKNRPKYLDWYASIYGNWFGSMSEAASVVCI
jgi:hypothetical protein